MITAMDVGQAQDPAAVVTLAPTGECGWRVERSETLPLGTPYRVLAGYAAMCSDYGPVLIDRTGVGRAVVEDARAEAGPAAPIYGVTSHAGKNTRWTGRDITVPKAALVRAGQVAIEHEHLELGGHPELAGQLRAMTCKRGGRMEAAGSGPDDLADALLLAVWAGTQLREDTPW